MYAKLIEIFHYDNLLSKVIIHSKVVNWIEYDISARVVLLDES